MDQGLISKFLEYGLLGALVVVEAIAIVRLNAEKDNLWKRLFDLQNERLSDSKKQLEIVNSIREMFEAGLKALRATRG